MNVAMRFLGLSHTNSVDAQASPAGSGLPRLSIQSAIHFRSRLLSCQRVDCSPISSQLALAVLYRLAFGLVWGYNAQEIAC